jgi:DNA-binding FadR family transcriptional regulator
MKGIKSMASSRDGNYGRRRYAKVVNEVGYRIVKGLLLPGDILSVESELVDELGVGRSAVREGMKVLAGKGLIETRTSAGTVIKSRQSWNLLDSDILKWRFSDPMDMRDLEIISELRVAIEPGAARLAAESRTPDGLRQVEVALAGLWANTNDVDAFVKADLQFHRAVFVASRNDLLLYVHDMAAIAMREVRLVHSQSMQHNVETLPQHEQVAVAIRRRQHRKAEEVMRTVVEVARKDLRAALAQNEQGDVE